MSKKDKSQSPEVNKEPLVEEEKPEVGKKAKTDSGTPPGENGDKENLTSSQSKSVAIPVQDETKSLNFRDHTQLMGYIRQMIRAKAIPRHLETPEQVLCAWNYAAQLMLPPQPSLRNIAVIEGTPSLFGDLPLALVQRHDEFLDYSEMVCDKEYEEICFENKNLNAEHFAAVVFIQRKGMKKPKSYSFTVEDATKAGINKEKTKNGRETVWAKYPKDMLIRKARIRAIRAHFADALSGAQIAEDFGYAPDLKDVTPASEVRDRVSELNGRFDEPLNQTVLDVKEEIQGEYSATN